MEGEDYLYACVEAGVALAGFSALMIALRQRGPSQLSTYDRAVIATLVERGLMAAFCSLLPLFLLGVGVTESRVWAFSSGALAAYYLSLLVRGIRIRLKESEASQMFPSVMFWLLAALGIVVIAIV